MDLSSASCFWRSRFNSSIRCLVHLSRSGLTWPPLLLDVPESEGIGPLAKAGRLQATPPTIIKTVRIFIKESPLAWFFSALLGRSGNDCVRFLSANRAKSVCATFNRLTGRKTRSARKPQKGGLSSPRRVRPDGGLTIGNGASSPRRVFDAMARGLPVAPACLPRHSVCDGGSRLLVTS
jgi:hypothetical protein